MRVAYLASGDVERVLAVLVVATPCPLILATPIAIIGGVNRAARRLIVVRNGGALEQLGGVTTAVFDKTGTLTVGTPQVSDVVAADGFAARRRAGARGVGGAGLGAPAGALGRERGGVARTRAVARVGHARVGGVRRDGARRGAAGVGGRAHLRGGAGAARARAGGERTARLRRRRRTASPARSSSPTSSAPSSPSCSPVSRELGVRRWVLLSGDSKAHTEAVAAQVGLTDARGELLPADKVDIVAGLVRDGERVLMVGDGTNDAPALSTATVGVALAGHGGGITAEAADVVILNDDPSRVVEAIQISRRTLRIARQSIWTGLGLSAGRDGGRRDGLHPAGDRCAAAGGDRRRRDPQRAADERSATRAAARRAHVRCVDGAEEDEHRHRADDGEHDERSRRPTRAARESA